MTVGYVDYRSESIFICNFIKILHCLREEGGRTDHVYSKEEINN